MDIPKQSFSGYGGLLRRSWQTMWKNPIAFMPVLYSYVGFLVIAASFFLLAKGAYGSLVGIADAKIVSLVSFGSLFAIVLFFFAVHVLSLNVSVMRQLSMGKRIGLSLAFRDASGLYRRTLGSAFAMLVASLPLFVFAGVILLAVMGAQDNPILLVVAIVLGILLFLAALAYGAWFMFIVPMIGFMGMNGWELLSASWRLLFRDSGHVLLTYLINFGISLGVGIVLGIISLLLFGIGDPAAWWQFLQFAINLVVSIWLLLFVFAAYVQRYKPKVR